MVAPVVVAGGIALATALAQYANSEQGRKMSAKERQKLKEMIDAVQKPNFDWSMFTPEQYKMVGQYTPQLTPFVEEKAPHLTQANSQDAQAGRKAQRDALNRLMELSKNGTDQLTEMERTSALNDLDRRNRGQMGAISESFNRRGQAGGAKEMLAQMFQAQAQNETAADTSTKYAIEAQRRKLQALMDGAQLGGQIRREDVALEQSNNDLLNQFNQRFATRKQGWENDRANTLNDAQLKNLNLAQDISNRNVGQSNEAFKYNQGNQNTLQQKTFDNEMSKVKTYAGITDMARNDINANTAAQNQAISGLGGASQQIYSQSQSQGQQPQKQLWQGNDEDDDPSNPLKRRYQV